MDPEVLGGRAVFRGTRVPVDSMYVYLERGHSVEKFLECFASVTKEMAAQALEDLDKKIPEDFFEALAQARKISKKK